MCINPIVRRLSGSIPCPPLIPSTNLIYLERQLKWRTFLFSLIHNKSLSISSGMHSQLVPCGYSSQYKNKDSFQKKKKTKPLEKHVVNFLASQFFSPFVAFKNSDAEFKMCLNYLIWFAKIPDVLHEKLISLFWFQRIYSADRFLKLNSPLLL